jgi:hypothetical protein
MIYRHPLNKEAQVAGWLRLQQNITVEFVIAMGKIAGLEHTYIQLYQLLLNVMGRQEEALPPIIPLKCVKRN